MRHFLGHTGTPITEADGDAKFHWAAGDFNRDGLTDLYRIKNHRHRDGTGRDSRAHGRIRRPTDCGGTPAPGGLPPESLGFRRR
jgi:hypothetical protein